jgi:acyl-CoA thioesterase
VTVSDATSHIFEGSLRLDGSGGRYDLMVDPTWEGQPGVVYGGFTLAVLLRAAGCEGTSGRPASLACQFLRPLTLGEPVRIDVTALRRGRSSDLFQLSVTQSSKLAVEALVRTTTATVGPELAARPDFDLGNPGSFRLNREVQIEDGWERLQAFEDHVEIRCNWGSRDADSFSWVRLGEGLVYEEPFLEAARLALFLDQQAPAVLNRLGFMFGPRRTELPWGFTNLDMLIHFHRIPGTDWLCYLSKVNDALGGVASGQTQVWSEAGQLLATALSQVAFFPSIGDQRYG